MKILPEPIFFSRIIRGTGPKRKLVHIENKSGEDWDTTVSDITKPEWIDVEDMPVGHSVRIKAHERMAVIVNVDSSHQFFPMSQSLEEKLEIKFEDEVELRIPITIQEVLAEKVDYPGVFGLDFGTTNTCFASKNRFDPTVDPAKASLPAKPSAEIPSLIFFKDVSLGDRAKYAIGTDAAHDIKEYSWQTYAYFVSIKRMLGSGKEVFVLDADAGHLSGHRQCWPVERVAGFIIKEVLTRAEDELGAQIQRLVATYPTLYSQARCEALLGAYKQAFELMGREWNDERVNLIMDEANAAAFNYIYAELLEEFKVFDAKSTRTCLLSYDFGGGTVDVAMLDVGMSRDERRRIKISTDLRGITGDLYFGGDNISLAAFEMLKSEVVRLIAENLHHEPEVQEEEETESIGPFNLDGIFDATDDEPDPDEAAAKVQEEKEAAAKEQEESQRPPPEVVNREDREEYSEAVEDVYEHRDALKIAVQEGISLEAALAQVAEKAGSRAPDKAAVQALKMHMEMLVPTQFASYENTEPLKEDAAKKIFYELWHEADQMKIRLSSRGGEQRFDGLLKRISQYANVDPKIFNDNLTLNYAQLERRVQPDVEQTIRRTHALYTKAATERDDGLVDVPKRILLAGNSSKLPLVRSLFCDIFEIGENDLVFQADRLKTAVSQGAAEGESLRRDFGENGLIQWETVGAVDRLPYSIGLFSPDLKGLAQYDDGFIPIFARGVAPEDEAGTFVATQEEHFLVHPKMDRLAMYADYGDGMSPNYLGVFEFDGPIAPDHTEADGTFSVVFKLLPNRTAELRLPNSEAVFPFKLIDETVDPKLNPFSGVH